MSYLLPLWCNQLCGKHVISALLIQLCVLMQYQPQLPNGSNRAKSSQCHVSIPEPEETAPALATAWQA
jgi:hypothetical protein